MSLGTSVSALQLKLDLLSSCTVDVSASECICVYATGSIGTPSAELIGSN